MVQLHRVFSLLIAMLFLVLTVTPAIAQLTEGFETGLPTSAPTVATNYTLSSGVWTLYRGVRNTTKHSGTYAVQLQSSATNPSYIITPALNTVGSITLWTRGGGASTTDNI